MLLSMVDMVCCENPQCRDFAKNPIPARGARTYYCPVCGKVSYARPVDAALAASPSRFEAYLRKEVSLEREPVPV